MNYYDHGQITDWASFRNMKWMKVLMLPLNMSGLDMSGLCKCSSSVRGSPANQPASASADVTKEPLWCGWSIKTVLQKIGQILEEHRNYLETHGFQLPVYLCVETKGFLLPDCSQMRTSLRWCCKRQFVPQVPSQHPWTIPPFCFSWLSLIFFSS